MMFGRRWYSRRWFSARWFGGPQSAATPATADQGAPWWWWAQYLRGDGAVVPSNRLDGIIFGYSGEVSGGARKKRGRLKFRIVGHRGAVVAGATASVRVVIVAAHVPTHEASLRNAARRGVVTAGATTSGNRRAIVARVTPGAIVCAALVGSVRAKARVEARAGIVTASARAPAIRSHRTITALRGTVTAKRRFDPVVIDNDLLMLAAAA